MIKIIALAFEIVFLYLQFLVNLVHIGCLKVYLAILTKRNELGREKFLFVISSILCVAIFIIFCVFGGSYRAG